MQKKNENARQKGLNAVCSATVSQSFDEFHLSNSVKITRYVFLCGAGIVYLMALLVYLGYAQDVPMWYANFGAIIFAPTMLVCAFLLKLPSHQHRVRALYLIGISLGWLVNIALLTVAPWTQGRPIYIEAVYLILVSVYLFSPLRFHEAVLTGLVPSAFCIAAIANRAPNLTDTFYTLVFLLGFNAMGIAARFAAERYMRQLHWMHQRLNQVATKDPLTLLPNRRGFDQHVKALNADEWVRSEAGLAFVIFDLDNFKDYNDSYGHPTGDRLLRALGNRLVSLSADVVYDMPARFGGDEFAGIWHCDSEAEAQRLALHLSRKLQEVIHTDAITHPSNVGISVGAAWQLANQHINLSNLYERADSALYGVKQSGKGSAKLRLIKTGTGA